jgi:hypothetical protein
VIFVSPTKTSEDRANLKFRIARDPDKDTCSRIQQFSADLTSIMKSHCYILAVFETFEQSAYFAFAIGASRNGFTVETSVCDEKIV